MSENVVSFDSVLSLCQHQDRRIVLGTLTKEQRSATLNDLIEAILEHTHRTPLTEASEDVRKKIRIRLIQIHLPKLAAAGLISHDSERDFVELTEQFDQVRPTLSTILNADLALDTPIKA